MAGHPYRGRIHSQIGSVEPNPDGIFARRTIGAAGTVGPRRPKGIHDAVSRSDVVGVEYGQIYVMDGTTTWSDPISTIGGQRNGLCGARWPGALVLITGLHTGQVLFTVDVDETAPPIDHSWETSSKFRTSRAPMR